MNANFDELINQINDNASRILGIESDGLVAGGSGAVVDCAQNADGPDALQNAIDNDRTKGTLTIEAVGSCNGVFVSGRTVVITTTPAGLTILPRTTNNGPAEAALVEFGMLVFFNVRERRQYHTGRERPIAIHVANR